jgi:hypothetical protein
MAVTSTSGDRFANVILTAIEAEVRKIAEEEAEKACERVTARCRERINEITVRLFKDFSFESGHDHFIVKVKHEGKNS